jgi:hypothetical protein
MIIRYSKGDTKAISHLDNKYTHIIHNNPIEPINRHNNQLTSIPVNNLCKCQVATKNNNNS